MSGARYGRTPAPPFGINDYIAWEAQQCKRHEFLNGKVFAMTGAKYGHSTITGNIPS